MPASERDATGSLARASFLAAFCSIGGPGERHPYSAAAVFCETRPDSEPWDARGLTDVAGRLAPTGPRARRRVFV